MALGSLFGRNFKVLRSGLTAKGHVKELEEYHRWREVLVSWLALIDDNSVNQLRQSSNDARSRDQAVRDDSSGCFQVCMFVLLPSAESAEV